MSLAAAHRLLQTEDALRATAAEALKNLTKKGLHPLGGMVLIKKTVCIESDIGQVSDINDRVDLCPVEHGCPRVTKRPQRKSARCILM